MLLYRLRKLFHPEIFQGKFKKKHYFEGWYFKLIDQSMEHALAIIPGISMGKNRADSHAFIQILYNGRLVHYYRFDHSAFRYHTGRFAIRIGENYFSESRLSLKLEDHNLKLYGNLIFKNILRLPKSLYLPGIMGPFTYIPFMECYHGIVNIHHDILGAIKIGDKRINFTGGYGYIEKDWGRSFPKTWIWLQSNHFGSRDATIMFSAARIPWMGSAFPGFISFLRMGEKLYLFATYTGAKLIRLDYGHGILKAVLRDRSYRLELSVTQTHGGELKAPSSGRMERTIVESINSEVRVLLFKRSGELLFDGTGTNAGLEIILNIIN